MKPLAERIEKARKKLAMLEAIHKRDAKPLVDILSTPNPLVDEVMSGSYTAKFRDPPPYSHSQMVGIIGTSEPEQNLWFCSRHNTLFSGTRDGCGDCHKESDVTDGPDDNDILRESLPEIKSHILATAGHIVNGARRGSYGKPEKNFERIALIWAAWFKARGIAMCDSLGEEFVIGASDISPLMRLMKEARLCETPDHLDSFVDIVGYALTGAEVNEVKP